jgi:molecular chaperone GrpE
MADQPEHDAESLGADATTGEIPALDPMVLKQERDDFYDRWLRKTAEFDNYRRRVERERREQTDKAVVDLLLEILLIVDDFDRARAVGGDEASPYRKGVDLIHAKLNDLLRKQGVKPMNAVGKDFDPNLHQAVSSEPAGPGHRDGEVLEEFQRGYTLDDRLLRAAMVKVAKG